MKQQKITLLLQHNFPRSSSKESKSSDTTKPPLKDTALHYESFEPETELHTILEIPENLSNATLQERHAFKLQKLNEYKQKLIAQREGLAQLVATFHSLVFRDNKLPSMDNVNSMVEQYARTYHFSREQYLETLSGAQDLVSNAASIRYVRELYKNDYELF